MPIFELCDCIGFLHPVCGTSTHSNSIACNSQVSDASLASILISSSGQSMTSDIDYEESSGSDFEEEYSWPAFGGRDVHNLLYENADVTMLESYLLSFQYSVKHRLSKIAFSELLRLINVHLPQSTVYPTSAYQMKSFFMELFPHATPLIHEDCTYCLAALPDNGVCATFNCPATGQGQFLTLPVAPQLRRILEGGCGMLYVLI